MSTILPPPPDQVVQPDASSNGGQQPEEEQQAHQHVEPALWVQWRQKLQALLNDTAFHERRTKPKNVKLDPAAELRENVYPMLSAMAQTAGHGQIEVLENVVIPGVLQAVLHAMLPDLLRQMLPDILDEIAPRDQLTPEMAELLSNTIHDLVDALGGEDALPEGLRAKTDKALTAIEEMTMDDLDEDDEDDDDGGEELEVPPKPKVEAVKPEPEQPPAGAV